jgi:hypothetical protein
MVYFNFSKSTNTAEIKTVAGKARQTEGRKIVWCGKYKENQPNYN